MNKEITTWSSKLETMLAMPLHTKMKQYHLVLVEIEEKGKRHHALRVGSGHETFPASTCSPLRPMLTFKTCLALANHPISSIKTHWKYNKNT